MCYVPGTAPKPGFGAWKQLLGLAARADGQQRELPSGHGASPPSSLPLPTKCSTSWSMPHPPHPHPTPCPHQDAAAPNHPAQGFQPFPPWDPSFLHCGWVWLMLCCLSPPLFLADCCTLRAVRVVWVEGRINYSSGQSGKICFPLQNPLPPSPRDPSAPRLLSQESGSIKSSPLALLARQAAPSSDARNAVGGQTAPREQNPGAMGTGGKGRAPLCSIRRLGTRARRWVWVRGGGGIKVTRAVSGLGGWDTLFGHE